MSGRESRASGSVPWEVSPPHRATARCPSPRPLGTVALPFQDAPATPRESTPRAGARPGFRPRGPLLGVAAWPAACYGFPALRDAPDAFPQGPGRACTFGRGQTSGAHACGGARLDGAARVRGRVTASPPCPETRLVPRTFFSSKLLPGQTPGLTASPPVKRGRKCCLPLPRPRWEDPRAPSRGDPSEKLSLFLPRQICSFCAVTSWAVFARATSVARLSLLLNLRKWWEHAAAPSLTHVDIPLSPLGLLSLGLPAARGCGRVSTGVGTPSRRRQAPAPAAPQRAGSRRPRSF